MRTEMTSRVLRIVIWQAVGSSNKLPWTAHMAPAIPGLQGQHRLPHMLGAHQPRSTTGFDACQAAGCAALACMANVLAMDQGVENALASGLPAVVVALANQARSTRASRHTASCVSSASHLMCWRLTVAPNAKHAVGTCSAPQQYVHTKSYSSDLYLGVWLDAIILPDRCNEQQLLYAWARLWRARAPWRALVRPRLTRRRASCASAPAACSSSVGCRRGSALCR